MAADIQDMILDINARVLANDVLAVRLVPIGQARHRYYAFFVNGQYTGVNYFVGLEDQDVLIPFLAGTTIGSLWIEDAGRWPYFDNLTYVPSVRAISADAVTAQNILFKWSVTYSVVPVEGDSQISVTSISGAQRAKNLSDIPGQPHRGRLTYSITTTGTTHIVRWWGDGIMVAEGQRVGDGSLTCSETNSSGLEVVCVLTYSEDIPMSVSRVDIRWPAQFLINYSLSPLVFPRTAQLTVNDNGRDDYVFPSPALTNGTYYWTVIEVDDEGIVQSSGIPVPTPLVINSAPESPTITSVTGDATGLVVTWSGGTLGSFYTVYCSHNNVPVNYGRYLTPAPIVTAVNATTATLDPVLDYATVDLQPYVDDLEASFDAETAAMNAIFAAGEAGFSDQVTTSMNNLITATEVFAENVGACAVGQKDALRSAFNNVLQRELFLDGLGLSTAIWQNDMGVQYAPLLSFLGDQLKHQQGRYTLPNGAVGGGAMGSAAIGTGANPDGTTGLTNALVTDSIEDLAIPFQRDCHIRIVVRATLGGIQETQDLQYVVELDNSGNIVSPRPPSPNIVSTSVTKSGSNYIISANVQVLNDNNNAVPTSVNIFAAAPGMIDLNTPQGSQALPTPTLGSQQATVTATVSATGWLEVQVTSKLVSTQSGPSSSAFVFVASDGTAAVNNLRASVTRGRSNLNGPGT